MTIDHTPKGHAPVMVSSRNFTLGGKLTDRMAVRTKKPVDFMFDSYNNAISWGGSWVCLGKSSCFGGKSSCLGGKLPPLDETLIAESGQCKTNVELGQIHLKIASLLRLRG